MSIDQLQEKIRKAKNPTVLELCASWEQIPPALQEAGLPEAHRIYFTRLLEALKGKLAAVRFDFASFAVLGEQGIGLLREIMALASSLGYYVLLESPALYGPAQAQSVAEGFLGKDSLYPCDGLVIPAYSGSDIWKPFLPYCEELKKDVFVAVRTANRSAPELQDLLVGGRLVHTAAADHVNRYGAELTGKCGYSRVAIMASASAADSLRTLRSKYPRRFILVDGLDYPHANAKNCAAAFDKLGHGAAVCVGSSITLAWKKDGTDADGFQEAVEEAAERVRKNLCRYVSIL